jgi:hypothetical protein
VRLLPPDASGFDLYRMPSSILTLALLLLVLYALGTVVSLIGTGFLIGVRLVFSLAQKWGSNKRENATETV